MTSLSHTPLTRDELDAINKRAGLRPVTYYFEQDTHGKLRCVRAVIRASNWRDVLLDRAAQRRSAITP